MRPTLARETEIKLEASPSFRLPDLTDVARGITARRLAIVRQRAIYMDTGDRRPARKESPSATAPRPREASVRKA
jgi:inorganic triphosphatase YgiF